MNSKIKKWFLPLLKLCKLWLEVSMMKKEPRKILVVPEFDKFGGTRTYFFSLLDFLHLQNYQVVILLYPSQIDNEVIEKAKQYNFTIHENQYYFGRIAFHEKVFTKFNINPLKTTVHALNHYLAILKLHRCSLIISSVGTTELYLFFFLLPTKLVYIIHTVVEHKLDSIRRFWLKSLIFHSKKILTVSQYSLNAIRYHWFSNKNTKKISYIYNFFPTPKIEQKPELKEKIIVLTIGSVEWYKNPEYWFRTAQTVVNETANVYFYWLGDGTDFLKYKELSGNNERIQFLGFRTDVNDWYRKASIYFQPSIKESFGIAVAGAMAHKLPCVVSDKEGLPELVIDNQTGMLVNIDNIRSGAMAIIKLSSNFELRQSLGKNANIQFLNLFTEDIWRNKLIAQLLLCKI